MKYLLLFTFLLWGCATTRSYENALSTWRGKSADQLLAKWGTPTKTTTLKDGGRVYTYNKRHPDKLKIKNKRSPSGLSPLYNCKTKFLVDSAGTILGWSFKGPNCRTP